MCVDILINIMGIILYHNDNIIISKSLIMKIVVTLIY